MKIPAHKVHILSIFARYLVPADIMYVEIFMNEEYYS